MLVAGDVGGTRNKGEVTVSQGKSSVAILGGGNLGRALARGWTANGPYRPQEVQVTRRSSGTLDDLARDGFQVGADSASAVKIADVVVLAVQPQQLVELLDEIGGSLDSSRHMLISVVSGVSIAQIQERVGTEIPIVRAMPNTAVSIGDSMTCLAAADGSDAALAKAEALFNAVGRTLAVREEMIVPATALCACGVAFFLRAIRAASQGGIEIGFHPAEALLLAAQTAKGAAGLLLGENSHPESEIDRVTTPRGCTIAGLNEMEHQGFSSALIKGILLSASKAAQLFEENSND